MKKIIYTRPDGGVSVVTPVINTHPLREKITEEVAIARALVSIPEWAINTQVVEENEIPVDRTFRDAWKQKGLKVEHDMEKAREIHRNYLRALRVQKLSELDTAYMRADEAGDVALKVEIAAKKQVLRDVTADSKIDAAASVDELKAAIPPSLK